MLQVGCTRNEVAAESTVFAWVGAVPWVPSSDEVAEDDPKSPDVGWSGCVWLVAGHDADAFYPPDGQN